MSAQPASLQALAKPLMQLREDRRVELLRADVIEEEERARADDGDVVDAMIHEVLADGVVPVHGEGELQLRAHAIDARDEHRVFHPLEIRRGRARRIRRSCRALRGRACL